MPDPEFPPTVFNIGIDTISASIPWPGLNVEADARKFKNGWRKSSGKDSAFRMEGPLRCHIQNFPKGFVHVLNMTAELSRYDSSRKFNNIESFNINPLTLNSIKAFHHDIEKASQNIGLDQAPLRYFRIGRLDVFFDIAVPPCLEDMISYTDKNRKMVMRIYKAGYVFEHRKNADWASYPSKELRKSNKHVPSEAKDFKVNRESIRDALSKGEITIYIQNKSRKIRIYRKMEYKDKTVIRIETSYLKASSCRPLLGDPRQQKRGEAYLNLLKLRKPDVLKGLMAYAWKNLQSLFNDDILNSKIADAINEIGNRKNGRALKQSKKYCLTGSHFRRLKIHSGLLIGAGKRHSRKFHLKYKKGAYHALKSGQSNNHTMFWLIPRVGLPPIRGPPTHVSTDE